MLFPIPKFSPAVALVLELRYLTGQTFDNLWPFGKKNSSSKTTFCWSVGNPSISICTLALLSIMGAHQYIIYTLSCKETVKKNKCHENTSKFLILWVIFGLCQKETVKKYKCNDDTSKGLNVWVHDLGVSF